MSDQDEGQYLAYREKLELAQAVEYALTYDGDFEFMVAMHEKAKRVGWTPTRRQVRAILRCKEGRPAAAFRVGIDRYRRRTARRGTFG